MNSLKSVIEIKNGKIANKSGSKYPVFGGNGIIGYSDEFNYENIIVIGRVGANCGSVHKYEGKCWVSDNALAGLPLNNSNSFNYYLIKSFDLNKFQIGSSQPLLTQTILYNINITFPKSEITQQKIAAVLSALDDKIEVNNKINAELEAMAKTLYDYWFVQFEFPITNESHPELVSGSHPKGYKSAGGKMIYNPTLKREIPEGWEVKRLFEIANITMGQSPSGESYNEKSDGMIFFQGSTDFGWRYPENRVYTTAPTRFAKENDILLSVRAPIGTMNIAMNDCCIGRGLSSINSKDNFQSFLIYQMNYFKKKFDYLNSVGTTFGSLTKDDLYNLELYYPSTEILEKFEKIVSVYDAKIKINTKQNQELAQLRDWLLPMLMNGQVKVEDVADEVLEKVAEPFVDYQINNLTDKDKKIRRKMLATYIINQSLDDTSFGKTKFEKLLHLVESHIVKGDYNQKYSVQAAGPYDGGFTKVFWNEVTKSKWFEIKEFGKLKRIVAGENHIKSQKDYGYLSDELKELINNFISKFKNSNYERPEIVSTLFAVWNNRIIRNEMITDALLKKDFLEWDEQKARYENRLDDALAWMRNNNVIPTGWGNEIKRVKK